MAGIGDGGVSPSSAPRRPGPSSGGSISSWMPLSAAAMQRAQLVVVEGRVLGRALDLDEAAAARSSPRSCRRRPSSPRRSGGRGGRRRRPCPRRWRPRSRRAAARRTMPCFFRWRSASTRATKAPVMEAVRVPPSAWITSQSTQSVRSPRAFMSTTARSERPMRRWISWVRPEAPPRARPRAGCACWWRAAACRTPR